MAWKKYDPVDGKPRYIRRGGGDFCYLSKDKNGALDDIPEGWKVVKRKNGHLGLVRVQ